MGQLEDILFQMHRVYHAGDKESNPKITLARIWTEKNDWSIVCQQWIDLFEELSIEKEEVVVPDEGIKGLII